MAQMLKCLAGRVIFVRRLLGQRTCQGYSVATDIVPVVWWVHLIVWIDVNVYSYTLAALSPVKGPQYQMNMRLGDPHSLSEPLGERSYLFSLSGIAPWIIQPISLIFFGGGVGVARE